LKYLGGCVRLVLQLRGLYVRSAERKLTRLHSFLCIFFTSTIRVLFPNANEKYFVLAGLSIFEAQADWFSREMDKLAESIDAKNPASVEFHASAQYARRVAPWNTMTRDDAHGVTKSVLQIVADSYDTARIFACAVEKSSVLNDDPVAVAFEDLCSRFDMFLSGLRASGDRQRGLLVLDKSTHETSLQQLTRDFRRIGTQWGSIIRNLADIPFFADSNASRLIQCADHIAYAVFRRYHVGDSQLFDIIAPRSEVPLRRWNHTWARPQDGYR